MNGSVRSIRVASERGAPTDRVEEATAVAGRGLEGDRYFDTEGTFADREGSDITFIEREALEAVERDYDIALEPGVHRRNVTTEGVALNHLDGERFRVGDLVCEGTELCEPCAYLERHLEERGVREALVHRGGLRARILEGGVLRPGDDVEPLES
ncbi:MOSC domain-containing protein [Haloterrigena sp. SYSU A558-1]|uniref:MOSC domain-containing protein n=1 Tax=Haloterrigena gelatinilytica TaxID=2741724 RepID=A0ABX2L5W0_9EURY|nr:MOSC domain-containing protein [Haloterrigena gelatinilytica]NUC70753.1 MOSC domain-containing protein [Haloterrigena gelatinilytica]